MLKRTMMVFLCLLILLQSIPISVFADLNLEGYSTEAELRQAIAGDEEWKERFPKGLFNFIGTSFQIEEGQEYFEISIVRQGGTQGEVSVDFKAIDISAEYGKDYVIRVYENSSKNQIGRNPDSFPIIQSLGDNASITISEAVYGEADETVTESVYPTGASYIDLARTKLTVGEAEKHQPKSLREAREAYLGQESDRPDWKTVDESKVEELKAEYDKFLYNVEGTETTIKFGDGEYIKYLYLVPLNDKLSESEEQVLFALGKPTGGAVRGEFYMSYLNLIDDEKPEAVRFQIETPEVTAKDGKAEIIVKRTSGLEQYSTIDIGTEEGTAKSGTDYDPGLKELFFVPGTSEQTIYVNILDNPNREEERRFKVALDRTSNNVNLSAAEAVVTIPSSSSNSILRVRNKATVKSFALSGSGYEDMNTEKLSNYGYSPERGKWIITGEDFSKDARMEPEQYYIWESGEGFQTDYTSTWNWSDGRYDNFSLNYPIGSMGGVDELSFDYFNSGDGRINDKGARVFDFFTRFRLEGPYAGYYKDGNVYGETKTFAEHGDFVTYTRNLEAENVTKADSIAVISYADNGNNTAPYFSGIKLRLKEYKVNITTCSMFRTKYKLTNSSFAKDSTIEFSPGSFFVKQVNSRVGNYQDYTDALVPPAEPKVFRSDRIEFGYKYNEENPNGNYARYTGFEVKGVFRDYWGNTSDRWIYHEGTELVLDDVFFKTDNIYEGIKNGTIEIRPVFVKNEAALELKVNDGMTLSNIGTAASFISTGALKLYKGDVITGLEISKFNESTSKLPTWTSYLEKADIPGKPGKVGVVITDSDRHTKIDYTLEGSYNTLSVNLRETLIVKAYPSEYKHRVQMLPYKLDGIAYPDREAFTAEIEKIYDSWDRPEVPDMDPTIELEFKYSYDTSFPDSNGEEKFGTPRLAYLFVYKKGELIPSTYELKYINGTFKLTGKLKELKWESDDYASVVIEGSTEYDGVYVRTREMVIDFLYNSADGVVVMPPDSEGKSDPWEGNIQRPIVIETANPLDFFNMKAATSPGFVAKWIDFSPDADNSGELEDGEKEVVEKRLRERMKDSSIDIEKVLDQRVYMGNNFSYMPQYFNPSRIYYLFDKVQAAGDLKNITVKLTEQHSTVLRPDALTPEKRLKNAEVYIGAKRIYDNNDGIYKDSALTYVPLGYYLGQVFYQKQIFNITAQVGNTVPVIINPSSLVRPDSATFKAQYKVGGELVNPENPVSAKNPILNLSKNDTVFSYKMKENTGVKVNETVIRIYDGDDKLLLETFTGPPDKDGTFTKSINTFNEEISEGSYMTIAGMYMENDVLVHEYPEVEVGLLFSEPLTSLSLLASFKLPYQSAIDIIGKVNNQFDLGLNVNAENNLKTDAYYDKNGVYRYLRVLNIGFNSTYEKKFVGKTKLENDTEETKDNLDENGNVKGNDVAVKDEVGSKDKDGLGSVAKGAAAGADAGQGTKNTGGGVLSMPYKISILLVMELGQEVTGKDEEGHDIYETQSYRCLSSLVIMATANADYRTERTYMTPVGLPVTVTLSAGGGASAAVVFDAKGNDRYNAKYRLDGKGTASLAPANYDIYSKFMLKPYIELDAGTGYGYLKLNLTGRADFDFNFNVPILGSSKSSGSGYITSITATLKVKMLFAQKKWTLYKSKKIDLFTYGVKSADTLLSALDDPYRSILYEKVQPVDEEDILSRDYLSVREEWNGAGDALLQSSAAGSEAEKVLQAGVFPHPQTKLIKLDQDRTLLLFVEDDAARDDRNRATLMYSIIENGTASAPVPLDQDGTWDEDPDAFVVDDRILITWSDAGREFSEADTEHDILGTMNISGAWLDLYTAEVDEEFTVTKSVYDGDNYADVDPKISYDPASKRLMVFYTKTDHSDRWNVDPVQLDDGTVPHDESPEPLYGDIVNGYSTIAYRYADYDGVSGEFVWNESYEPEESLDADKYYGQRFPELAPAADIVEVEHDIQETVKVGGEDVVFTHKGTTQTIMPYSGLQDPRIEEMDLITYNGQAVLAYIMDQDSDPATQYDYKLYIQTYDYSTKTFSYPIEIVNDTEEIQDTKPRFVRADGYTYLYWLRGGDIVYTCIDDILGKDGRLKEAIVPGTSPAEKFYIIDKTDTAKDAHINTAVEHEGIIDDYNIASNGDSIYTIWVEQQSSYKDGLKQGDPGTEDPASLQKESHLYAACDVPGMPWSRPVRLTYDPETSYSDISFTVLEDDSILAAYAEYIQQYDEATGQHTDDKSVRSLVINTFTTGSGLELGEITADDKYYMPGEAVEMEAVLTNKGLKAAEDIYYQYYMLVNGSQYSESSWYPEKEGDEPHHIMGGADETLYGNPTMPASLDGVESLRIGFRLKNKSGDILASKEKAIPAAPKLQIHVFESYLTAEDEALVNLLVENTGNKDFEDTFSITAGDKAIHTEQFTLPAKGEKSIFQKVGLMGASFEELSEAGDGSYFDELKLDYSFGEFDASTEIKRSISPEDYADLQKIERLKLTRNGSELQNGSRIAVYYDDIVDLKAEVIKKVGAAAPENLEVEWRTGDKSVAAVMSDGTLIPMGIGRTTVTAALQPAQEGSVSYSSGAFRVRDAGYTIPEGAKKKVSIDVVIISRSEGADPHEDNTAPKPAGSTILPGESLSGDKLTLTLSEAALQVALKADSDNLVLNASNSSTGISQVEMMFTADNFRAILESKVNRVTLSSMLGNISFDRKAIAAIAAAIGEAGNKQAVVGFSVRDGIIEITVMIDGKRIMDLGGGTVLVSTGYKPEGAMDSECILVYELGEDGVRRPVPTSLYNAVTGELLLRSNSAGRYEIGYNKVEFSDDLGWAEDYIALLASRDIIKGVGDGRFMKDKAVTRAEFITILSRLADDLHLTDKTTKFKDVAPDSWYAEPIKWAYENGIVSGTGDTEFSPDKAINREEMAVILFRYMKYAGIKLPLEEANEFGDQSQLNDWSRAAVNAMRAAGLMVGTGDNNFEPGRTSGRAEAAKVIAELIKYLLK